MRISTRLSFVLTSLIFTVSGAEAATVASPHTRVTYPSAVSLEMLGRSMLYSINFDQVVNDDIAVGAGIGSVSTQVHGTDTDTGHTATMVPVYMNYYFMRAAGTPFVTAGVSLVLNHSTVKGEDTATGGLHIPSSNVMPTFGAGYENRGDNGFLFRVAGYGIAGKSIAPWVGFSFGFAI